MMELEAMLRGDPEEWNGLLVYPVRMRDYPLLLTAQESITASQQSFPAPWCTVRYLDALYGMEGMFPRLCLMLGLAFGLPVREERLPLYPEVKGDKLLSLRVVQGERAGTITPRNFGELRTVIARQNGLELPDETQNAELVEAQNDLRSKDALPLKGDFEALIYAVALKAGVEPQSIMDWTVRRFQATERALDRATGHLMASITLAAGGKFKGGNPYPSWKYDREEQTQAIEPLSALSGRLSGSVEQR